MLARFFRFREFETNARIETVAGLTTFMAMACIIVGSLIMLSVRKIQWGNPTEGIPAFLAFAGIPPTYNIGDGMALGFISYVILKLCSGRHKELNWVLIITAAAFICKYVFLAR